MDDRVHNLEECMANIMSDYFKTFKYEPFKITVLFINNLWETYFSLRPDHKSKFNQQLPAFNGTVVPPRQIEGTYTVLVDINYLLEDIQKGCFAWVGTIIHEATHARDYIEYARLIGAKDYDEVLDTSKHRLFQIWTEFNARRHGYYFVRKYSFEDMTDTSQLPGILQTELPFHINYMTEKYHETTDGWEQIYTVTQFLGRLSVWRELFPQYFTLVQINALFNNNDWMYDMFMFLDNHRKLSEAHNDFIVFKEILSRNFQGL